MASPARVKVPKKSIVSEATRERETFRYDDSLFTNVRFNDTGLPVPSNELSTCPDVILTALARLAASQTGAARAMISLFDQTHQYIIAEASSITPLIPSLGPDGHPETLWHFDDVTLDPEYSTKPYCRPGGAARFYAAVPIRTDRGVNIGVICVIHTEPSLPWEDRHSRLMRELSRAVTEHLETISLRSHQRRSERKSWGLTSFVEGNTAPLSQVSSTGREYAEHETRGDGIASYTRPRIDDLQQALGGMSVRNSITTADSQTTNALHTKDVIVCAPQARSKFAHDPSQLLETPKQIFSKAASIVKDSIETDGCLFLNADMLEFSSAGSSTEWIDEDLATRRPSTFSYNESEDAYTTVSSDERLRPSCQALGSSEHEAARIALPQALLARMIRQYPRGHVFNYDTDGNLLQEELPDDSTRHQQNNNDWGNLHNRQDHRFRVQQREASILLETFPGARSIAFVPVWDLRKKRWSAGGFIHTYNIKRTFTIDLDLSYLRALGMLAAAEAFKLETLAADKAKTDALGSLSHELRSPLHGAVLSVELLNDTELTIPQQNIVRIIETCCRTLSDTIDHLLEYSKVNKALPQEATRETQADGSGINRSSSVSIASKPSRKVVQLDVLAEEVLESVYAGFNFQQVSLAQSSSQTPRRPGHTSIRRMDTMQAMEELQAPSKKTGNLSTKIGDVDVFLVIDSRPSWGFYTQPGPVRRIIMNLFGNSLKYTQCGIIKVSLEQTSAFGADDNDCWVTIKVSDTGVGISEDFLQNGLFKPFSQENHLSPGTGLGLSFVKQITAQFGGHISVDSRVGIGTTVTVRLPMKLGDDCHHNVCEIRQREEEFDVQTEKLRGLRVRLVDFNKDSVAGGGSAQRTIESPDQLVQDLCKEWLNMQVNTTSETPCFMADLAIWSEEGFERPSVPQEAVPDIPNIVLCANAVTAHQYATGTKTIPRPGVFEFISQPSPFPASEDETPTQPKGYFRASEFLLVDDNFINLKILSSYMKKLKQPYQTASDGLEAVTAYEADPGRYSCILMDISMPVMDGFEATRRIRAFESQQGLRPALILALTGLASEEAQREATVSGLDLFLTKPVRLKELGPILRAKGVLEEESNLG
ncbi:related to nik-1 protein (Os-1p protein) [Fusarium proliferatum]|nr:related to nik-1 protein (Os-1p protein) [Fusarium proliferatum]